MTPAEQIVVFGPIRASFVGYSVSLVDEPAQALLLPEDDPSECEVHASGESGIADLVEALRRRDGLLCSLEYAEGPDRSVSLSWSDYDMEEELVGGRVDVPADQVGPLADWLSRLRVPELPDDPRYDDLRAVVERERLNREAVRERLFGGLPASVDYRGDEYLLHARTDDGRALYSVPHAAEDDPLRWLVREDDGALEPAGRPRGPRRGGGFRRYLAPKLPGATWRWVRTRG